MSRTTEHSSSGVEGAFPTYKTKSTYPGGPPAATIYFDGIMLYCFDGDRGCTVAVNNRLPDHALDLGVSKKGEADRRISGVPDNASDIRIVVENPVEEGVYVYAPSPSYYTPDGKRCSFVEYALDLEGPVFHDDILPKIPDALSPRFHINSGLFFGYKLSTMLFDARRGNGQHQIGKIALALGADIFVKTSSGAKGSIKFYADDDRTPFFETGTIEEGDRYEIKITNTTGGCEQHVEHVNAAEPTDFRLNYEALDIETSDRFSLFDAADPAYPLITLGEFIKTKMGMEHNLCDSHPCTGGICGRTRQFPRGHE